MKFKTAFLLFIVLNIAVLSCTDNILDIYTDEKINNPSGNYRMASYTRRFRDGSIMERGNFSYSIDGLIEKLEIDIYSGATVSSVLTISFGHDDNGRLSSRRHVNSQYTSDPLSFTYLYDENGQLDRIRFLYNLSTSYPNENYTYLEDGRLNSFESSRGNFQINWNNNRIVHTVVDGYNTIYSYNSDGNCITRTYETLTRTGKNTYQYNSGGRLWKYTFYDDLGPAYTDTFSWEVGKSDIDFSDIETDIKYDFGFGWF